MFEIKACEVLKTKEFTLVYEQFSDEYNADIGHYGQTLNRLSAAESHYVHKMIEFVVN